MGIEHVTIVTCDRCKRETRYDSTSDPYLGHEWAWLSPATVTPYGHHPPHRGTEGLICASCLTDAEREQLERTSAKLQYDETFGPPF
jgi:hypothetical protein